MSDLISRSELINKIRGIVPGSQDVDFIVRLIENQQTAYSVDKVVEQLEKLPKGSAWNHNSDNIDRKKTIEIVKGGGVDDNLRR